MRHIPARICLSFFVLLAMAIQARAGVAGCEAKIGSTESLAVLALVEDAFPADSLPARAESLGSIRGSALNNEPAPQGSDIQSLDKEGLSATDGIADPSIKRRDVYPEPATVAVWSLLGLAGLGLRYWHRQRGGLEGSGPAPQRVDKVRPRWSEENRAAIFDIVGRGRP